MVMVIVVLMATFTEALLSFDETPLIASVVVWPRAEPVIASPKTSPSAARNLFKVISLVSVGRSGRRELRAGPPHPIAMQRASKGGGGRGGSREKSRQRIAGNRKSETGGTLGGTGGAAQRLRRSERPSSPGSGPVDER